jgi:hypothetical protein
MLQAATIAVAIVATNTITNIVVVVVTTVVV